MGGAAWEESEGSERLGWGRQVKEAEARKQKWKHSCGRVRVGWVLAGQDPLWWAGEGWLPSPEKDSHFWKLLCPGPGLAAYCPGSSPPGSRYLI